MSDFDSACKELINSLKSQSRGKGIISVSDDLQHKFTGIKVPINASGTTDFISTLSKSLSKAVIARLNGSTSCFLTLFLLQLPYSWALEKLLQTITNESLRYRNTEQSVSHLKTALECEDHETELQSRRTWTFQHVVIGIRDLLSSGTVDLKTRRLGARYVSDLCRCGKEVCSALLTNSSSTKSWFVGDFLRNTEDLVIALYLADIIYSCVNNDFDATQIWSSTDENALTLFGDLQSFNQNSNKFGRLLQLIEAQCKAEDGKLTYQQQTFNITGETLFENTQDQAQNCKVLISHDTLFLIAANRAKDHAFFCLSEVPLLESTTTVPSKEKKMVQVCFEPDTGYVLIDSKKRALNNIQLQSAVPGELKSCFAAVQTCITRIKEMLKSDEDETNLEEKRVEEHCFQFVSNELLSDSSIGDESKMSAAQQVVTMKMKRMFKDKSAAIMTSEHNSAIASSKNMLRAPARQTRMFSGDEDFDTRPVNLHGRNLVPEFTKAQGEAATVNGNATPAVGSEDFDQSDDRQSAASSPLKMKRGHAADNRADNLNKKRKLAHDQTLAPPLSKVDPDVNGVQHTGQIGVQEDEGAAPIQTSSQRKRQAEAANQHRKRSKVSNSNVETAATTEVQKQDDQIVATRRASTKSGAVQVEETQSQDKPLSVSKKKASNPNSKQNKPLSSNSVPVVRRSQRNATKIGASYEEDSESDKENLDVESVEQSMKSDGNASKLKSKSAPSRTKPKAPKPAHTGISLNQGVDTAQRDVKSKSSIMVPSSAQFHVSKINDQIKVQRMDQADGEVSKELEEDEDDVSVVQESYPREAMPSVKEADGEWNNSLRDIIHQLSPTKKSGSNTDLQTLLNHPKDVTLQTTINTSDASRLTKTRSSVHISKEQHLARNIKTSTTANTSGQESSVNQESAAKTEQILPPFSKVAPQLSVKKPTTTVTNRVRSIAPEQSDGHPHSRSPATQPKTHVIETDRDRKVPQAKADIPELKGTYDNGSENDNPPEQPDTQDTQSQQSLEDLCLPRQHGCADQEELGMQETISSEPVIIVENEAVQTNHLHQQEELVTTSRDTHPDLGYDLDLESEESFHGAESDDVVLANGAASSKNENMSSESLPEQQAFNHLLISSPIEKHQLVNNTANSLTYEEQSLEEADESVSESSSSQEFQSPEYTDSPAKRAIIVSHHHCSKRPSASAQREVQPPAVIAQKTVQKAPLPREVKAPSLQRPTTTKVSAQVHDTSDQQVQPVIKNHAQATKEVNYSTKLKQKQKVESLSKQFYTKACQQKASSLQEQERISNRAQDGKMNTPVIAISNIELMPPPARFNSISLRRKPSPTTPVDVNRPKKHVLKVNGKARSSPLKCQTRQIRRMTRASLPDLAALPQSASKNGMVNSTPRPFVTHLQAATPSTNPSIPSSGIRGIAQNQHVDHATTSIQKIPYQHHETASPTSSDGSDRTGEEAVKHMPQYAGQSIATWQEGLQQTVLSITKEIFFQIESEDKTVRDVLQDFREGCGQTLEELRINIDNQLKHHAKKVEKSLEEQSQAIQQSLQTYKSRLPKSKDVAIITTEDVDFRCGQLMAMLPGIVGGGARTYVD